MEGPADARCPHAALSAARSAASCGSSPARCAGRGGRRGVVLQPYRGYGSPDAHLRHRPRLLAADRRGRGGEASCATSCAASAGGRCAGRASAPASTAPSAWSRPTTTAISASRWRRAAAVPADRVWHRLDLAMEAPENVAACAEVYIPPAAARVVVVSDIDDTVMHTGVANKAAMLWRLFVEDAESRTVFPGVAVLYRALHAGAGGDEGNPMLYVSRAPWGIYEILEEFFRRHEIPVGPILFLREWGLGWRQPAAAPRRGPQAPPDRGDDAPLRGHALRAHRRQRPARPGNLPGDRRPPPRAGAGGLHPRRRGARAASARPR